MAKAKAAPKALPRKPTTKAPPKKTAQSNSKSKSAITKKRPKPDTEDEGLSPESPSQHDDSVLSMTPPSAKKQKRAPVTKKSGVNPLQENENEAFTVDGAGDAKSKKGPKHTEQYQKVSKQPVIANRH